MTPWRWSAGAVSHVVLDGCSDGEHVRVPARCPVEDVVPLLGDYLDQADPHLTVWPSSHRFDDCIYRLRQ